MLRSSLLPLVALTVACSSPAPAPTPISPDTWATVDGRIITKDQVEKAIRRAGATQPLSPEETLTAQINALDTIVMEEILLAKAGALKIEIPAADVDKAFAEARQGINEDAFKAELTRRNVTEADMREGVRREMLTRKVLDQEITNKVTVSDQDVADFFGANRASFNLTEEAYRLAQIVITAGRDTQVANRTGDDATTPEAARAKVTMLMERLKAGSAFGDLAMDYSEDPESAQRGGDLGLVPVSAIKQAPPALRNATLGATPGSARLAANGNDFTIVYVVAHEPAGQRELTTPGVKEQITQGLKARKEQLLRAAYLAAARTDSDVVNYLARRVVSASGVPK